jgi:hypothetical protein
MDNDCLKYYLKDYNFCKEKNDNENLKKTIEQIVGYHLERFQFNEALKY